MDNINQEHLLKSSLTDYYSNDKFQTIYDISVNPKISLRVIDWFVTNYSKKNNIVYNLTSNGKPRQFNVYTSYKSQLKSYSKKFFDPFCRRERIHLTHNNETLVTTIGQLNFFKWAIDNRILSFIYDHYDKIDKDMNKCILKHNSLKKATHSTKKRKELSKSSYLGLNCNESPQLLYFD